MLIEFIRLWRHLDERTQRALLVAACAYEIGGGAQMTTEELVKQGLQGILVLVGDYRGSHAETAGYVDKGPQRDCTIGKGLALTWQATERGRETVGS